MAVDKGITTADSFEDLIRSPESEASYVHSCIFIHAYSKIMSIRRREEGHAQALAHSSHALSSWCMIKLHREHGRIGWQIYTGTDNAMNVASTADFKVSCSHLRVRHSSTISTFMTCAGKRDMPKPWLIATTHSLHGP